MSARVTAGFTLIEVMVALAIFMIMALGIGSLTQTILRTADNNTLRASAAMAAASVEAKLLAHLANKDDFQAALIPAATAQTISIDGPEGKYVFTVRVTSAVDGIGRTLSNTPPDDWDCPLSATIQANWNDNQDMPRFIQHNTVFVPTRC